MRHTDRLTLFWTDAPLHRRRTPAWAWRLWGSVLASALLFQSAEPRAQGCTTVQPGADWVCVAGGWLPPDQVTAPPPTAPPAEPPPAPPTGPTVPGPLQWMGGTAIGETIELPLAQLPMSIRPVSGTNVREFRGKVYTAPAAYQGPIAIIESLGTIVFPLFNLPRRMAINDLTIAAKPGQDGVWLAAHDVEIHRLLVVDGATQFRVIRSVGVLVDGSTFGTSPLPDHSGMRTSTRGVWFSGTAPGMNLQGGGETELSITSFTMRDSRITGAAEAAIRISHGRNITLEGLRVEGNPGAPLNVTPDWRNDIQAVVLRDSWQENNGHAMWNPTGVVSVQGGGSW